MQASNGELFSELLALPGASSPVIGFILIASVSLLPFLVLTVTSYLKLSVVFGILRSALGAGNIPSATLTSIMSLILSLHIMVPVFSDLDFSEIYKLDSNSKLEPELQRLEKSFHAVKIPLEKFLAKHSRLKERKFFLSISDDQKTQIDLSQLDENKCEEDACLYQGEGLSSLVPSFILSELREAFAIGFLLFLPFLIIDLVVANLLVGMGMMMVSPISISLPFKIFMFVACDGWFLLSKSLMLSYGA